MYISYDYYRIFYYVAKYGSFTKAAEILMSNQPNLTRAIKNLESELECKLFIRSKKGVSLTQDGEDLFSHISLAFAHIQAGEDDIMLKKELKRGLLSIGSSGIAMRYFLPPFLNEYRQKYPLIRLKTANMTTPQAVDALKEGSVDIAIVTSPVNLSDDLCLQPLTDFSEIAVCGKQIYEKIKGRKLSLNELSRYPFVSISHHSSTYELYSEVFAKSGLSFSPDIEVSTIDQIAPLIRNGLGIGFLPESAIEESKSDQEIYPIKLKEAIPKRSICLVTHKSRGLRLPAKKFVEMISPQQLTLQGKE